jgi:hypothetical protein
MGNIALAMFVTVGTLVLAQNAQQGRNPDTYWVYVPAQYSPAEEASLMIFNDRQAFMNPAGNFARTTFSTT